MGAAGTQPPRRPLRPTHPAPTEFSPRQKKLEGKTWGSGTYQGKTFDRWQYEVTSGGRIFYFVDDPTDQGRQPHARAEDRDLGDE